MQLNQEKETLVYLDTNVVDAFLKSSRKNLETFLRLKHCGVRYVTSQHLLTELLLNKNVSEAEQSFKIAEMLASKFHFFCDVLDVLKFEINYVKSGQRYDPFRSRSEAQRFFDLAWSAHRAYAFDEKMRRWNENEKRRLLAEDKKIFADLKNKEHSTPETFEGLWELAIQGGNLAYRIEQLCNAVGLSLNGMPAAKLAEQLNKLPSLKCGLLFDVARLFTQQISKSLKPKRGDDYDGAHLFCAAYVDIFVSSDSAFLAILDAAGSEWPFKFMTPEDFCSLNEAAMVESL